MGGWCWWTFWRRLAPRVGWLGRAGALPSRSRPSTHSWSRRCSTAAARPTGPVSGRGPGIRRWDPQLQPYLQRYGWLAGTCGRSGGGADGVPQVRATLLQQGVVRAHGLEGVGRSIGALALAGQLVLQRQLEELGCSDSHGHLRVHWALWAAARERAVAAFWGVGPDPRTVRARLHPSVTVHGPWPALRACLRASLRPVLRAKQHLLHDGQRQDALDILHGRYRHDEMPSVDTERYARRNGIQAAQPFRTRNPTLLWCCAALAALLLAAAWYLHPWTRARFWLHVVYWLSSDPARAIQEQSVPLALPLAGPLVVLGLLLVCWVRLGSVMDLPVLLPANGHWPTPPPTRPTRPTLRPSPLLKPHPRHGHAHGD